ncbi:hypothetical protein A3J43_02940 [Candidatus Uhrbacteria bacterium RIFCSPHIGHO2_12_FULL_54_23]|uniref:Uncharacterized protein n=3 Tax=Candidatus Uhriibacteriota TaxID=1752732 RepID=A0A1F7VGB7_9BACT|nr:MAG: hypothetical protein A3J43_02930 [Candidatus Uhrbacteria bacterium RIFCSPHIGHO2_12_FULL_54_23]OGL77893.1 MAG: hypothetical protein A3J43_02940 [Candidatus Uhrbacteria bacterium RIFCSPHIGHO2_12_FULL_54_23]OGL85541.1 MAG: hypothetical protein A3B36_00580 [Candidatus Uhrbacteria bacterium RIFCSPLOWO2_01_FULL_55_36]OGL89511.1 MAG: hypothetical protein A3J36_03535 [Candidatus Uhrbacteria bacterium RIFCSPLOWO2_02_FULL_54_37]OGL89513.1 MAG: hypothetical protein A3J36_03545 [Candidatus Uhrbacte
MPTATIPAIYTRGKIIPAAKPPFEEPDEVMVTFIKYPLTAQESDEDPDEVLFRKIEPQYRAVREDVVKEMYPEFYAKYIAGKKENPD